MAPVRRNKLPNKSKRYSGVIFRYHGNYVGPGWSAGKYQASVADSKVPAVDEFDRTAKEHDRAYALGKDLKKADYKFFKQNWGKGLKRSAAAAAVGFQGYLRPVDSSSSNAPEMYPSPRRTPIKSGKKVSYSKYKQIRAADRRLAKMVVINSARKRKPVIPKKSMSTQSRKRRVVSGDGIKSSGRFSKRSASSKMTLWDRLSQRGVVYHSEIGTVVDGGASGRSVYVGHNTDQYQTMRSVIACALAKIIGKEFGLSVHAMNDSATVIIPAAYNSSGFSIQMWCRVSPASAPSQAGALISITQNATTWQNLRTQIESNLFDTFGGAANANNVQFTSMTLYANTSVGVNQIYKQIDLSKMYVDLYIRSKLKLQNRTVSVATNVSVDDINACPLVGKSYFGTGNYIGVKQNANLNTLQYIINSENATTGTGLWQYIAGGASLDNFQEPPGKSQMVKVQKVGPCKLNPGEIKTSEIYIHRNKSLNQWVKILNNLPTGSGSRTMETGKYALFGFEKMVNASAGTVDNSIKIAAEAECRMGCSVKYKNQLASTYITREQPL